MILRYIYIIFLGIFLTLFVGVGISTFYTQPTSPTPLISQPVPAGSAVDSKKAMQQETVAQKKFQEYDKSFKMYNRNVSIVAILFSVTFMVISFSFIKKSIVFSDGFLAGGLLTLLYGIGRGFASDDNVSKFIVVTFSLLVVLLLGYKKFLATNSKPALHKK